MYIKESSFFSMYLSTYNPEKIFYSALKSCIHFDMFIIKRSTKFSYSFLQIKYYAIIKNLTMCGNLHSSSEVQKARGHQVSFFEPLVCLELGLNPSVPDDW